MAPCAGFSRGTQGARRAVTLIQIKTTGLVLDEARLLEGASGLECRACWCRWGRVARGLRGGRCAAAAAAAACRVAPSALGGAAGRRCVPLAGGAGCGGAFAVGTRRGFAEGGDCAVAPVPLARAPVCCAASRSAPPVRPTGLWPPRRWGPLTVPPPHDGEVRHSVSWTRIASRTAAEIEGCRSPGVRRSRTPTDQPGDRVVARGPPGGLSRRRRCCYSQGR